MLVVDASALVELLLRRPTAVQIATLIGEHGAALHAPHLIDLEVLSALRRLMLAGHLAADRATLVVADLRAMPLRRHPHTVLAPRVWALRANFTPYDAAYVALAEALSAEGTPLLTTDARLAAAVVRHTEVRVHAPT